MGLFDVFKKKDCEICGKEVGMFGYKKLEDGEICKDCVKLLSPWFDDRRHSTVEQIKAQLAYREENSKKLADFHPSKSYGDYYKLMPELQNGVPTRFIVACTNDYREENADIIAFKDVTAFQIDIDDSYRELKYRNDAGEMVSYSPPRYEYSYNFYAKIQVNHPYFENIRFQINSSTLHLETVMNNRSGFGQFLLSNREFDPMLYPEYRQYKTVCVELELLFQAGLQGQVMGVPAQAEVPVAAPVAAPAAAAVPVAAADDTWKCPSCGSENKSKFCQGCGAAKPAPVAASGWKCFCGTVNTGRFCENCGTEKFSLEDIECSECSWTAEPEDKEVPAFCPNCGKKFNSDDL